MASFNRNILIALGSLILITVLYYFREIVLYILLAWVLSLLGAPMMRFFRKRIKIGKWQIGEDGAALLTLATFFAIMVGSLLLFIPPIVSQGTALANIDYHQMELRLQKPFADLDLTLHQVGLLNSTESLSSKLKDLFQQWFDPAQLGAYAGGVISAAGNLVALISVVSFILFFFLRDHDLFDEMVKTISPQNQEGKVLHALKESSNMLTRYFLGLMVQAFSFALIVGTILFAFGVPNAYLIGAFGGIMNLVPYVGPLVGSAFGIFITLSSQVHLPFEQIYPSLVKVAAAFLVTQLIDNFLLQPYISSKSVKAHPLEIFLVTLAGAQMGGLLGMVVAIPAYTVLRVFAKTFLSEFRIVQKLTSEEEVGV
jgi:predicted PurR-regulated permease PerM